MKENYASTYGGGIHAQSATSTVIIRDTASQNNISIIRNNQSDDYGGGIALRGSTLNMYNGTVYDNSARNGGGISELSDAVCSIANATIRGNTAESNGGGIYVSTDAMLSVSGASSIINNSAPNGESGGIYTEDYSYLNPADTSAYSNISTADTTVFSGNTALAAYVPPSNASDFIKHRL